MQCGDFLLNYYVKTLTLLVLWVFFEFLVEAEGSTTVKQATERERGTGTAFYTLLLWCTRAYCPSVIHYVVTSVTTNQPRAIFLDLVKYFHEKYPFQQ